ncbi:MAG TPA: branched-chain amino acid aminotransferase [Bacteroidota bacterium]|nr:branched-chain amino acid aminotransferase [Candidatus Kapabacteria bacterium]HRS01422.1 branched-chain amino acid aminotransferase [Bacteroidota bacterium]
MSKFKFIPRNDTLKNSINWSKLGFGRYFADYMYISHYKDGNWEEGEILPYQALSIEPAMMTLHYAQTIFEGLKAYKNPNGGANLFRPEMNAKRINHSAEMVVIPPFPEERFLDAIKELVYLNREFIPSGEGETMYIRPFIFGSSNIIGVHPSKEYTMIIIMSPVGPYYEDVLRPVKIKVSDKYVRAVRGGLGSSKAGANYAASLRATAAAEKEGYSQVLWLDGVNLTFVDEVGSMNIMFVLDGEIITPSLESGTILAGVTRDSVLKLARHLGYKASEKVISIKEVIEGIESGRLTECFGTGTAAAISPVGLLSYGGKDYTINNFEIGPISQQMYDTLLGIQYGKIEDPFGWITHIDY